MGSHRLSRKAVPSAANSAHVQEVLGHIRRIVRVLRESSRASERKIGLTSAQLFVLQRLAAESPLSLNQLAERTLTHQSSVSVVVRRLVEQGLVRRRAAPRDARRLQLSLTSKARGLLSRAPDPARDRLLAAIEKLPRQRLGQLAGLLEELTRGMEIDRTVAPMFVAEEQLSPNGG